MFVCFVSMNEPDLYVFGRLVCSFVGCDVQES